MSGFNGETVESIAEKLAQASENSVLIYTKAKNEGHDEGYTEGYEDGKKYSTEMFWSNYMENGSRDNFKYAFAGKYWNKEIFAPPYDIIPSNEYESARGIFDGFNEGNDPIDMAALAEELQITLDFSNAQYFQDAFKGDGVSRWGYIDLGNALSVSGIFYGNGANTLKQIDGINSAKDTSWQNNSFGNQGGLTHVIFSGVIAKSIKLKWSPLDRESIDSIIACLSPDVTGYTVTLSLDAVNAAYETDEGANDGTSSTEWSEIVASNSGWNFVYL